ncbi:MAG TPA: T9SS type A sorting domain-containing protein [candidate division Zixibacteria bacterium]|nr:T9SS type A sorting domain-containing protein [candidate division Zixibacteria bacterium]
MVIIVLRKIILTLILGGMSLLAAGTAIGEVIRTMEWASFRGSVTTYNGNPVPVGSIVDAYDPGGAHCGTFTVKSEGLYGFMPVYADDPYTSEIDEGAELGNQLTFYLNGRLALTEGPDSPTWNGMGATSEVNLSASATVSIDSVAFPADQEAEPGDTVTYAVTVQNTGNGMDFYEVTATSFHGWIIQTSDDFVYAEPGQNATVYFKVLVPGALFYDVIDDVNFRVASGIDNSANVTGAVSTLVGFTTDIDDDENGLLPGQFELYQNYPNPFNPITTIAFDLTVKCEVKLEVFNILGIKVENHDLGTLMPGHHSVQFDGASLASGIYFYKIKAGDRSAMKKMALLK